MADQRDELRVAIIGAGPAGLYAADALLGIQDRQEISVDVVDRLPTPFGLVRYGVAPDHVSIRSVRDTLDRILDHPRIRFFGGVHVDDGTQGVSLEEFRNAYDAVFLTYGASADRPLSIPGEELPGSISATEFVRWYTGHPDSPPEEFTDVLERTRSVAVIGVGNVAVDVARILAKNQAELQHTDMPDHVLAALVGSSVEMIHLIGRRGPAEAAWTTKELRELAELEDASVRVDPVDVQHGPSSQAVISSNKVAARNTAVIEDWAHQEERDSARIIRLRFFSRPVRIEGDDTGVRALVVERTALTESGGVEGTGQFEKIPVDLVIRSVGYRGLELPGVPFDAARAVIPNDAGRVLGTEGPIPGLYTAGWIKRGPSGIIGTNKKDAVETVKAFIDDLDHGRVPSRRDDDDLFARLPDPVVDTQGWRRIDSAERRLGALADKDRTTIHDWDTAMELGARTG